MTWPDTRDVLAVGTVGGVFALAFKHTENGVFTAMLPLGTLVLGWYFGSSKSSSDKDATINAVIKDDATNRINNSNATSTTK